MRILLLLLSACSKTPSPDPSTTVTETLDCDVAGDRPASWTEATHGKLDTPDYDGVFDKSVVHRVDITIATEDYTAMYAELEELSGSAFGSGGTLGGGDDGPPEELDTGGMGEMNEAMEAACEGLAEGDACALDMGGMDIEGTCQSQGGALVCVPEDDGGMGGMGGGDLSFLPADPTYHAVTVQADGQIWCSVGMRFKGNATLISAWQGGVAKLPFRLDFDRYGDERPEIEDQRFFGFKELTFGSGQGDSTLLHEVLANEILEDRGVPAARNAFYAIHLDAGEGPQYLGLYTAMEDPSDAMMTRVFGEDAGNLYKPDGDCATLACFDEETFAKKSNKQDADWSDVEGLVAALGSDEGDAASWRVELESTADVDGFLRWLAVNTAIDNWDAYGSMAHNYYLYGVPADGGRLAWIPWDHNLSLMDGGGMGGGSDPLLDDVGADWPMIRRVLDDPTYAETYRLYLAEAFEGAYDVDAFEARAAELADIIRPSLFGADGEVESSTFLTSEADWENALADMNAHVRQRHDAVQAAVHE
ncbi:MAG: CotH kinase family protein [Pseudomonadota bacterium]|nr:CotH kinase family protein [Pseudomonadota bacterium]